MAKVSNSTRDKLVGDNSNRYVYGSAVPKTDFGVEPERKQQRVKEQPNKINKPKAQPKAHPLNKMSLTNFILSMLVIGLVVMAILNFVQLVSQKLEYRESVQKLELELSNLKIKNREYKNYLDSNIDVEAIKNTAFDLGMRFPKEGQIVTYEASDADYMRKVNGD